MAAISRKCSRARVKKHVSHYFHRKDPKTGQPTEQTNGYHKAHNRLLRIAEVGTVLVTPGISKGEAIVVDDALEAHLPLILLQKEPIGEFYYQDLTTT